MEQIDIFTLIVLACGVSTAANLTLVTPSGRLNGKESPGADAIIQFLGVPYANTPKRFEKAVIVTPWSDIRDAQTQGDICWQISRDVSMNRTESEDCLLLDIYAPASLDNSTELRSVMVWIHGGSFTAGSARDYDGTLLAEAGDVVVVVIQYRLGVYGFLESGVKEKSSNLGLWDQRLALQWVQANIHAFGGNANSVTVFGESAGSISISCHMLSPEVNSSLFQRAILQSGSILNGWTSADRSGAVPTLAAYTNCTNIDDVMACLQSLPPETLNSVVFLIAHTLWPTTDGVFLPYDTLDILNSYEKNGISGVTNKLGNMQEYDTLIGFNGDDGIFLLGLLLVTPGSTVDLSVGLTDSQYHEAVKSIALSPLNGGEQTANTLTSLMIEKYNEPFTGDSIRTAAERNMKQFTILAGDTVLKIPPIWNALLHSGVAPDKKTYFYLFDHKPSVESFLALGPDWLQTSAAHADDLPFILPEIVDGFSRLSEKEQLLSQDLMSYWTTFAKNGNPTSEDNSSREGMLWKKFSPGEKNYMRFTLEKDEMLVNPREDKPDFLLCIFSSLADDDATKCQNAPSQPSSATTPQGKMLSFAAFVVVVFLAITF